MPRGLPRGSLLPPSEHLSQGIPQRFKPYMRRYLASRSRPQSTRNYSNGLMRSIQRNQFLWRLQPHCCPICQSSFTSKNTSGCRERLSIDQLVQLEQENQLTFELKIFQALLDLVNSSAQGIAETGRSEDLIMNLEAIENRLTDEIFEYWSQNRHLKVDFRCDMGRPNDPPPFNAGYVFSTRIRNERHRASVNFDERSTGFIWFFSFPNLVFPDES